MEAQKICNMLRASGMPGAVVVNTCAVTAEAERQSRQAVRRVVRENPNLPIFITGCGATREPDTYAAMSPSVRVIANRDKMNPAAYGISSAAAGIADSKLSKAFIQIQDGCSYKCTYCITRILRGPSVSFDYTRILSDARDAANTGFREFVLTGINIAEYDGGLCNLCGRLLADIPEIMRLRLSSMDPASAEIPRILDLIATQPRMMPHLHLSVQSGCDEILQRMARRHRAADLIRICGAPITTSWDIICGFPGETEELFSQTADLARQLHPIHIHAFPFSPRPGTPAAGFDNQIPKNIARKRVGIINEIANNNRMEFMKTQIGKTVSVLVENGGVGRTPNDLEIAVDPSAPPRSIRDCVITG